MCHHLFFDSVSLTLRGPLSLTSIPPFSGLIQELVKHSWLLQGFYPWYFKFGQFAESSMLLHKIGHHDPTSFRFGRNFQSVFLPPYPTLPFVSVFIKVFPLLFV